MRNNLKELISEKLNEQDIFAHYIRQSTGKELQLGKAIRSPLRAVDKHPSFNVYKGNNGKIRFKDFAGQEGDVFEFIKLLFNCDFKQACQIIANDFNLKESHGISNLKRFKQVNISALPMLEKKERATASVMSSNLWMEHHLAFWRQFGIGYSTLMIYEVQNVISFKVGKVERNAKEDYRIYCYRYEDSAAKRFYCPDDKKLKHIGNANGEDIFGLKQLKEHKYKASIAILAAGQKDAMSITQHNNTLMPEIWGLALNSESCSLSKEQYIEIMQYTEKLVVLYDNDKTGRQYAQKLHEQYGIEVINIASFTKCKDISDYYKEQIINNTNKNELWEILQKMRSS
jgi:5S rRNA maturation endonuclease (ribonuclease M5)